MGSKGTMAIHPHSRHQCPFICKFPGILHEQANIGQLSILITVQAIAGITLMPLRTGHQSMLITELPASLGINAHHTIIHWCMLQNCICNRILPTHVNSFFIIEKSYVSWYILIFIVVPGNSIIIKILLQPIAITGRQTGSSPKAIVQTAVHRLMIVRHYQ